MFRDRQGFMQGMNMYVPGMQWAASVDVQEGSVFSLGRPAPPMAPVTINIGANSSIGYTSSPIVFSDTPYGRNIVLGVTTAPSAGPTSVRVAGEDYLGQPVVEQFVLAGATGKKAFYRVLNVSMVGGSTTTAAAFTVTQGANLGLPFRGSVEWAKENNVLLDPGTAFGKWVPADLTDPATATSGDPRGYYIPTAAPDGIKEYVICMRVDGSINANNNGGLHGIRHYAA
jgi:hypothetical protein